MVVDHMVSVCGEILKHTYIPTGADKKNFNKKGRVR